jgi:hypothetical protein
MHLQWPGHKLPIRLIAQAIKGETSSGHDGTRMMKHTRSKMNGTKAKSCLSFTRLMSLASLAKVKLHGLAGFQKLNLGII